MNNVTTRKERAIEVREAVLPWLRLNGLAQKIGDAQVLAGSTSDFIFLHRTPFSNLITKPEPRNLREAVFLQEHGGRNLTYGLDIWYNRHKVMNMEWNDSGLVHLVGFRGGVWEEELVKVIGDS